MRYLLSLFVLLMAALPANAQHNWYTSINVGTTFSGVKKAVDQGSDIYPGIMIDIEGLRNLGKHWQLGVSFETGKALTSYTTVSGFYNTNGNLVEAYEYVSGKSYVREYNFAPSMLARYRLNFNERSYAYGGVVAGVYFEHLPNNHEVEYYGSAMTGVDLGVAVAISDHAKFTVNHSWRMFYADVADRTFHEYTYRPADGYYTNYVENGYKHFFNFTVGIVAGL